MSVSEIKDISFIKHFKKIMLFTYMINKTKLCSGPVSREQIVNV